MHPLKLDAQINNWIDIGSVANLGAEVVAGAPQAKAAFVEGSPESNLAVAYFAATSGSFNVDYPFSEHATLIQGRVNITNRTTGAVVTYNPGDSWFIRKGDEITFDSTEGFVKHYMSIVSE